MPIDPSKPSTNTNGSPAPSDEYSLTVGADGHISGAVKTIDSVGSILKGFDKHQITSCVVTFEKHQEICF